MIRIVNARNEQTPQSGELFIRVDRSSPLGNPYKIDSKNTRDSVCNKYEEYFQYMIKNEPESNFCKELQRLKKLSEATNLGLVCHCYPMRCHAEVIKKHLENNETK